MVDLVGGLVALFLADPAVAGMAGIRVFGDELPAEETAAMPRQAMVVKPSGGVSLLGASKVRADTQRIDIRAYGATKREALLLLDAADDVLRGIERAVSAGVLIHWANSAGGFSTGRDRETDWPFAWRSWQVLHSLTEV
jgi:hypothetical protein